MYRANYAQLHVGRRRELGINDRIYGEWFRRTHEERRCGYTAVIAMHPRE